jgi:hypothetical protein
MCDDFMLLNDSLHNLLYVCKNLDALPVFPDFPL